MTTRRILLRGGSIVDGSGGPAFEGDVVIEGGRIVAIGPAAGVSHGDDVEVMDLDGRVVAPGFIDIHSHTDYHQFLDPTSPSKLRDGVTTEISGNCGFSAFPLDDREAGALQAIWGPRGVDIDWKDFRGYREAIRRRGSSMNRAFFVGHGQLRRHVVGEDDRPATEDELTRMSRVLDAEMEAGAIGLTTGLIYAPGCFASREELVELCRVVARRGGLHASHIRGEGDTLVEAVEEFLSVVRQSGVRGQLSHLKASRPENWPKIDRAFELIEAAQADGCRVLADRYPYEATSTGLDSLLPDWAHDGGRDAVLHRLRDPGSRAKVLDYMAGRYDEDYYRGILISEARGCSRYDGRYLVDLAAEAVKDPASMALDILCEAGGAVETIFFVLSPEVMRRVLAKDYVMVATDAESRAVSGPASQGRPHPRAYGTFCRVLGRLVREEGHLSLESAVRKMTAMPAKQLGLTHRGIIEPGAVADLVVFDPGTVCDRATYVEPHQYSQGVDHVLVSGQFVVRDGAVTDARPGQVLSSQISGPRSEI